MDTRKCNTCDQPRSVSSFACHYDSHSEICHACKDFCIHRVKLAHAKGVTVHELFAAETDAPRLRRYRALTKAGVVWEQVARRQHFMRGSRGDKRRRRGPRGRTAGRNTSGRKRRRSRSTVPASEGGVAAPAKRVAKLAEGASPSGGRRVSTRKRRRPSTMQGYLEVGDDAASVSSDSSSESVESACSVPGGSDSDKTMGRHAAIAAAAPGAGAGAGAGSGSGVGVGAGGVKTCAGAGSGAMVSPHSVLHTPSFVPASDLAFDAAVDAIVGGQDLGASETLSLHDLEYVMGLDSSSPPLFNEAPVAATPVVGGMVPPLFSYDESLAAPPMAVAGEFQWDRVFAGAFGQPTMAL